MDKHGTDSFWTGNNYACVKYTMVIVNLAIFMCGLILLGLGLWIKRECESTMEILESYSLHFVDIVLMSIVVGGEMCVLGILGCGGSYKQKTLLLWMFLIGAKVFINTSITNTAFELHYGLSLNHNLEDKGLTSLKIIYNANDDTRVITASWNAIMSKLHCCGLYGYRDFESSSFSRKTGLLYPKSCCRNPNHVQCDSTTISDQVIYMQGCFSVMLEMAKNNARHLGIASAFVTVIMGFSSAAKRYSNAVGHADKSRPPSGQQIS